MEERVKAGPLLPRWQKVKGRHKALSGKLYKTDLAPVLGRYDQALLDYDAEKKEEVKLKDELADLMKSSGEAATRIGDLTKQLGQATAKWQQEQAKHADTVTKFAKSGAGELSDVETHLDNLIAAAEAFVGERKQVYDQIDAAATENLKRFKGAQKSLGDKAKGVYDRRLKLVELAVKALADAQSILRDYMEISDDADHPEITKDLQSFKV